MRARAFCDEALTQPGPERGECAALLHPGANGVVTQPPQRRKASVVPRERIQGDTAEMPPQTLMAVSDYELDRRAARHRSVFDRSLRAGERGLGQASAAPAPPSATSPPRRPAHSFGDRPDRLTVWPTEDGAFGIDVRWHGRECILRAVVVRRLLTEAGYPPRPATRSTGAPGR